MRLRNVLVSLVILCLVVLFQNCGVGFQTVQTDLSSSQSLDDYLADGELIAKGQQLYSTRCASCHGPIESTDKIGRDYFQIKSAIEQVLPMRTSLADFSDEGIKAVAAALEFQASGAGLAFDKHGRLQFSCDEKSVAKSTLNKLTNREFRNSVVDVLNSFSVGLKNDAKIKELFTEMPSDLIPDDQSNNIERANIVTRSSTRAYFEVSYRAGVLISEMASFPPTYQCLNAAGLALNCYTSFVRTLARRTYRRPVLGAELTSLVNELWDSSLTKKEKILTAVTYLTQQAEFQYKVHFNGVPKQGSNSLLQLTDFELASRLSFFLTGFPPDKILRDLSDEGKLRNVEIYNQQVDRLLTSLGSRALVARLFRESWGYENFDGFSFPAEVSSGVDMNGLDVAMVSELNDFFQTLVIDQNATYEDLFTSRYSSASHQGLLQIYGQASAASQQLPAIRSGFLSRGAMLAKQSRLKPSPIHRGLKILDSVLCYQVGEPPADAPTSLPKVEGQILSSREVTERTTEQRNTTCAGCHTKINPMGFAFENFDSLGRVRSFENIFNDQGDLIASFPIDTKTKTDVLSQTEETFDNSVQLAAAIGDSERGLLCMARKMRKFVTRRSVTPADHCNMNEILQTLYGEPDKGQGSLKSALKQMVQSAEFKSWSY